MRELRSWWIHHVKKLLIVPAATHPGAGGARAHLGLWLVALAAAVVLVLGVTSTVDGPRDNRSVTGAQRQGRLISDCSGIITDWLMAVPAGHHSFFLPTQANIIAAADAEIRFRLVYRDENVRQRMGRLLVERGVRAADRVTWHRCRNEVGPWVRDLFLLARTEEGETLGLLHHADHYRFASKVGRVVDPVDTLKGLPVDGLLRTQVRTEGGEVVVDDERAFVSLSALRSTLRYGIASDEAGAQALLRATWNLPVTWVAHRDLSSSDHCDLYIMPAGKKRMVVGSPKMGAMLLSGMSESQRSRLGRSMRSIAREAGAPILPIMEDDARVIEALLVEARSPARLRAFKRLRASLTGLGYTWVEVPFLSLDPQQFGLRLALTYTNVVQDRRGGTHTIYLPQYGLPALDRAASAAWETLGCRVVGVDALGPAMHGGAIRCLSHVIKRRSKDGERPASGLGM